MTRRLPVRFRPVPGESFDSLIRRTAESNGISATRLRGVGLADLAGMTGVPEPDLARMRSQRYRRAVRGGHTWPLGWQVRGHRRYCPTCYPTTRVAMIDWHLGCTPTCVGCDVLLTCACSRPASLSPVAAEDAKALAWIREQLHRSNECEEARLELATLRRECETLARAHSGSGADQESWRARFGELPTLEVASPVDGIDVRVVLETARRLVPTYVDLQSWTRTRPIDLAHASMTDSVHNQTSQRIIRRHYKAGMRAAHVPGMRWDRPDRPPPAEEWQQRAAEAAWAHHLLASCEQRSDLRSSILQLGIQGAVEDLRLGPRAIYCFGNAAFAIGADALCRNPAAAERTDYDVIRQALRARPYPRTYHRPAGSRSPRQVWREDAGAWIWLHLTGGPPSDGPWHRAPRDVEAFDRSLDAETRLALLEDAQQYLADLGQPPARVDMPSTSRKARSA